MARRKGVQIVAEGTSITLVLDEPGITAAHARGADAWWRYATEVLDHLRLPYNVQSELDVETLPAHTAVVVLAHGGGAATDRGLGDWVQNGGAVVSVGDPSGLSDVLGVTPAASVDHGHVRINAGQVWTSVPDVALHGVGGVRLRAEADVEVLGTWDDGSPAITARRLGDGAALAFGVDVWESIVRIQQGYPVTGDGRPAADGSAPIDDDILKCEDGLALDLATDRAVPPGEPVQDSYEHGYPPASGFPMFHRPHADLWRSALLQAVWHAAEHTGAVLPWLHYWPAGVPAVAHMSHDSDQNVDEHGRAALDAFAEADVNVTWCQVFPGGYAPEIYQAVTEAGHEHALHFNAMHDADIAQWGWPQIRAQYAWAQAITGTERIVSNKNHYTRWEGFTEFYRWCERLGIQIDESRGPSKQGTVGFPFGTAHLSFPMADASDTNRYHDVLNLPLHTQDLAWASHESIRDVILDAVEDQHGVAHFLFHGPHLYRRPETRKACLALADEARRRGMPWWTAGQLNRWERLRRKVTLAVHPDGEGWLVESSAAEAVPGAGILLSLPGAGRLPTVRRGEGTVSQVQRHGRTFVELATDIPAGSSSWLLA